MLSLTQGDPEPCLAVGSPRYCQVCGEKKPARVVTNVHRVSIVIYKNDVADSALSTHTLAGLNWTN